ncbi:MAG: ABC transporter ATP-binding protein [Gammaproteobacteria bacterium]|nr:ABC transporter ATP-binding protein [Gammaproteobacteria bacterium]MDG0997568.1 ABC transporter ATP-binding protein [Gammaproteobacteria bacterium]MDG1951230.1 ABC transporter ATP-binding protein [Gammaproteobacteria bacterium]MDG2118055.1 ABC transporter ATP-binding protein [Gammaproteobacteria bacterium]
MRELLLAQNLTKKFKSNSALCDLNLTVRESEILCLLGANGAGKTTTINLFLGFLKPTSGKAFVDGLDVCENLNEVRKKLAYVPEQVSLYPSLTGLENLDYFVKLSLNNRLGKAELQNLLDRVGLNKSAANKRVNGYSKGMRQKVGLAISLAKNAQALLLDEPLSGLDPSAANEFTTILRNLADQGTAVLMATHDLFRAREIADRIGIMKSGSLVKDLSPTSVDQSTLEEIYLQQMRDTELV